MGCVIKYKGQSIPEEQFLQYLNKQITINNLFNEDGNLANRVYEALGFGAQDDNLKDLSFELADSDSEHDYFKVFYRGKDLTTDGKVTTGKITLSLHNQGYIDAIEIPTELRNKGLGKSIYRKVNLELLNGELKSDSLGRISEDAKRVWESLVKSGEAIKTTRGYKFKETQITPQQKTTAQQLYSSYIDTIFPYSKVKDIVYHGANEPIEGEKFIKREGATGGGIWFSGSKRYATNVMNSAPQSEALMGRKLRGAPTMYYALLNMKNPKHFYNSSGALLAQSPTQFIEGTISKDRLHGNTQYDKNINDGVLFHHPNSKKPESNTSAEQVVVFEPEQIHILSSKADIEGFKKFVGNRLEVKPGVEELFESNPEFSSQIYEALGFSKKLDFYKGDTLAIDEKIYSIVEKISSKELAKRNGLTISSNIPVYIVSEFLGARKGGYDTVNNIIILSKDSDKETIHHELIHSVEYNLDKSELNPLYEKVKNSITEDSFDGFISWNFRKNISEFVADALSKKAFRNALKKEGLLEEVDNVLSIYTSGTTPQQKQQAQQLYSQYLDSIGVTDIAYHHSEEDISEFTSSSERYFQKELKKKNRYIPKLDDIVFLVKKPLTEEFMSKRKFIGSWGLKTPKTLQFSAGEKIGEGIHPGIDEGVFAGIEGNYDAIDFGRIRDNKTWSEVIAITNPKNAIKLGSKQDIENFAKFVKNNESGNTKDMENYMSSKSVDYIMDKLIQSGKIEKRC